MWYRLDLVEWMLLSAAVAVLVIAIVTIASLASAPTCEERGGRRVPGGTVFMLVGKVMVPMPVENCVEKE